MAVNIDKVREQYATNREELFQSIADFYSIDLSEWTFTENSAVEQQGDGNDILVIFRSELTKEGEEPIFINEIIDYHRLAYSYGFGIKIEEPEPDPEEPTEEDDDL